MKQISSFILIASVFVITGCVKQCNPTYLSDASAFEKIEKVKGLPIKVNAEDNRSSDKKIFMKIGFMTYHENGSQPVQLARPAKEIVLTAFGDGFKQCGFTLNDDACVVADISIEKFFCTVTGGKDNEALIELDLSLREDDKVIYHKHISETYKQKFNAFRQAEDAQPLLSKCLTMAVDEILADAEFTNQIAANAQFFKVIDGKKATLIFNKQLDKEAKKANLPPGLTAEFNSAQVTVFDDSFFMSARGEFESNEEYVKRTTAFKDKYFFFDTKVDIGTYNYDQTRFDTISLPTSNESDSDTSYLSAILNREVLDHTNYENGIIAKNISVSYWWLLSPPNRHETAPLFRFSSSDSIKFLWSNQVLQKQGLIISVPPKAAQELKRHELIMRWKVNFPYPLGKYITRTYPVRDELTRVIIGYERTVTSHVLADILAVALIDKTENKILAVFSMDSKLKQ